MVQFSYKISKKHNLYSYADKISSRVAGGKFRRSQSVDLCEHFKNLIFVFVCTPYNARRVKYKGYLKEIWKVQIYYTFEIVQSNNFK